MANFHVDPDTDLVERQFAVVYAPGKQRKRFPENVVSVKESREEAMSASDPDRKLYAAVLYGPCRSSEGFRLFHLIEWL